MISRFILKSVWARESLSTWMSSSPEMDVMQPRRLPSRQFLDRYHLILKAEGQLEFKTDNRELFDFAVEELAAAGWKARMITYDLHSDEVLMEGNVMTEYEEKFSAKGNPICKLIAARHLPA